MAEGAEILFSDSEAEVIVEVASANRDQWRRGALFALCLAGCAALSAAVAAGAMGSSGRATAGEGALRASFAAKAPPKGWLPPWLQPCGGPCVDPSYTCVVKADKSYSQCIDCSETGNYKYDCTSYDNELRMAAVRQCGLSCELAPPTPPCRLGQHFESDYSVDECTEEGDGSVSLRCKKQSADSCGSRLSSHSHTGAGVYQITMQGAYGDGIATNFYIDTYGKDTSELIPFNEVKFEVWGKECYDDGSKILTSFRVAGMNGTHSKMVNVDFDACDDWHTYTIVVGTDTIGWKIDGEMVRREDMSDYKQFLRDIHDKGFETHFALWAQDEDTLTKPTAGMGVIESNDEDFPLYAYFAKVKTPQVDKDGKAPYQWIFDPTSGVGR